MLPVFLLFVWEQFRESFLFTASGFIFHERLQEICECQHCCLGNSQDIWNNLMFSRFVVCFFLFFYVSIFPLVEGYKILICLSYNNNPSGFGARILICNARLHSTRDDPTSVQFSDLKTTWITFHCSWKYRVISKVSETPLKQWWWTKVELQQHKSKLLRLSSNFFRSCSTPCSAREMGQVTHSDKNFPCTR